MDVRIETGRLGVGRDRLLVETAVTRRMHNSGEEFRVVAVAGRFAEQANERVLGAAAVGLEVGVVLVCNGEPRIQVEGTTETLLGALVTVRRRIDVLADDAVAAAEPRPRRRERRIEHDAAFVELARPRQSVIGSRDLVRAEVELVGPGVRRRFRRR